MSDYKIEWLPGATKDVARLREFIKKENPRAASNAGLRILGAVDLLTKNPETGMPNPDEDCEEFRDLLVKADTLFVIVSSNSLSLSFAYGTIEKNVL